MEPQALINMLFAVCGVLLGIIVRALWEELKELKKTDTILADKVQKIEVLVAGQYVTWPGLQDVIRPLIDQLNRIEAKLDGKQDKASCPDIQHGGR